MLINIYYYYSLFNYYIISLKFGFNILLLVVVVLSWILQSEVIPYNSKVFYGLLRVLFAKGD